MDEHNPLTVCVLVFNFREYATTMVAINRQDDEYALLLRFNPFNQLTGAPQAWRTSATVGTLLSGPLAFRASTFQLENYLRSVEPASAALGLLSLPLS